MYLPSNTYALFSDHSNLVDMRDHVSYLLSTIYYLLSTIYPSSRNGISIGKTMDSSRFVTAREAMGVHTLSVF